MSLAFGAKHNSVIQNFTILMTFLSPKYEYPQSKLANKQKTNFSYNLMINNSVIANFD